MPETAPFDWNAYPWLEPHVPVLTALAQEFRHWNAQINLVSRKEVDLLEARHILPCAAIAKLADFSTLSTHLDIGTGGGLPGLIIAALNPQLECTLLDATAKKLKAVEHMAAMIGLDNVHPLHARIEDHKERYDVVTGRGVTALPRFLVWARKCLNDARPPAGLYYWKGGDLEEELTQWNLLPDETHALEPLTGDAHFEQKYIAYYSPYSLIHNAGLKARTKVK